MKETVAFRLVDTDHADLVDKACDAGFDSVGRYVRALALDAARVEDRVQALGRNADGSAGGVSKAELQDIADHVAFLRRHVGRLLA